MYSIKDGVVRLYEGNRDLVEIEEFITKKKYLDIKPLPWYSDPNGKMYFS